MGTLDNQVCLITGSTGIAEATAVHAAEQGARVFVTSRTEANCRALAEKLGEPGAYRAAELTNEEQVDATVAACVEKWGRIDGLFNVAGISGRRFGDGPLHECTEKGWDATLDANAKSMFLVCRAVLQQMLTQQRGAILNMASVLALRAGAEVFCLARLCGQQGGDCSPE